jgi:hypothetical protein
LFYGVTLLLGAAALTGCTPNANTASTGAGQKPVAATQSTGTRAAAAKPTAAATKPAAAAAAKPTAAAAAKSVVSDVSELKSLGITLNEGVLIDVADDGLDRYLAVSEGGVVDFTGTRTSREDNKMMELKPARVAKKSLRNRVVIAPPFYNEDLGAGSCVADTAPGKLRLATCKAKTANQTWKVVPAGDSGQFELHGAHTKIRVDKGKITTGARGYVGLQTIAFAK